MDKKINKTPRRNIDFQLKLHIIKRLEKGERSIDVARSLRLAPSTVRSIKKRSDNIYESTSAMVFTSNTIISKRRPRTMEKMENLLFTWMQDANERNSSVIRAKARSLFEMIKSDDDDEITFIASQGWYENFKKRYSISKRKSEEETSLFHLQQDPLYEAQIQILECSEKNALYETQTQTNDQSSKSEHNSRNKKVNNDDMFTTKSLFDFLNHIEKALKILENDPDQERSKKVSSSISNSIKCYKDLYETKTLETSSQTFFKPVMHSKRIKSE